MGMMMFITICDTIHARTELVFQESGGGGISPPPSVQFKLYQGEVLQYKPGASDHQNRTRHGFESTHSENPQAPTQSERGMLDLGMARKGGMVRAVRASDSIFERTTVGCRTLSGGRRAAGGGRRAAAP